MRNGTALLVVTMLVVGACGGDDETSDDTPDADEDSGAVADDASPGGDDTDSADAGDVSDIVDDLDFGDGGAVVTIGDERYEFSLGGSSEQDGVTYIGVCQTLFGLITGSGYDVDGRDITIDFELPPPDWESYDDGRFDGSSPRIEIEIDQDGGWMADMESSAEAGTSQVDAWQMDENSAAGTATFIEITGFGAPVEGAQPVQGTFELGCADG